MKLGPWQITIIVCAFIGGAAGVYALGSETLAVSMVTLLGGWITPSPLGSRDGG